MRIKLSGKGHGDMGAAGALQQKDKMRTKIVIQLRCFHANPIVLQEQLWAIRPKRRSPRRPGWNRRAAAQRTSSATSEVPCTGFTVIPCYTRYMLSEGSVTFFLQKESIHVPSSMFIHILGGKFQGFHLV